MRAPASSQRIVRGTLRQYVTDRILSDILEGVFLSQKRLIVQQLADAYDVSPTPVRESLVELAGMGLVELLPNRGAVVRSFGRTEVREISQLRRVLEVEATRSAVGRISRMELADLIDELQRLQSLPRDEDWDQDVRDADTRLHALIAESCGSHRLTSEVAKYLTLFRALRDLSHAKDAWTNYSRSNDVPEHLSIVRALAAGDADLAALTMDRHIRSAAEKLESVLFDDTDPGARIRARDSGGIAQGDNAFVPSLRSSVFSKDSRGLIPPSSSRDPLA
jgi:DNA-binding GntR family transcriptional regulator